MKKELAIILFNLFSIPFLCAQEELKLWYEKPATQWEEALPIGNGYIGAMVFGGIEDELIQLNEGTLWSGGPVKENVNPQASQYLTPLREALAKEDYKLASELCRKMQGNFSASFLPLGDLHIKQSFREKGKPSGYKRELYLRDAITTTQFVVRKVKYVREVFISAPDSIMVMHITADKPEMITLDLSLRSGLVSTISVINNNQLNMNGKALVQADTDDYSRLEKDSIEQYNEDRCKSMRFQTVLKAVIQGGTMNADSEGIHIKNATGVTLFLSAATSFNGFDKCPDSEGKDEKAVSQRYVDNVQQKQYEKLKSAQFIA